MIPFAVFNQFTQLGESASGSETLEMVDHDNSILLILSFVRQ
jgi:hypothetical protein